MKRRLFPIGILIIYILFLLRVMVFKIVPTITSGKVILSFGGTNGDNPANFVPFQTILPYLLGESGLMIAFLNIVGNIILLVPVGFLVPFFYTKISWKKSLSIAIGFGFVIELMQVALHVGIFDIDDVILNALGIMAGYWIYKILGKWVREKRYRHLVGTAILSIVIAVGSFFVIHPHNTQQVTPDVRIGNDLCNGTGGTGQIITISEKSLTIKRRDGISEVIKITDKTEVQTPKGPASPSDLQVGDRVTLVVGNDRIALAVLVCTLPNP